MSNSILVVDDDDIIRDTLGILLNKMGHEVTLAENGQIALDLLSQHSFDLVISDVKMPKMGGKEVLAEIQRRELQIPLIIMTGFVDLELAVDVMRNGAIDFLSKPVEKENLRRATNRALEHSRILKENKRLEKENLAYRKNLEVRRKNLESRVQVQSQDSFGNRRADPK